MSVASRSISVVFISKNSGGTSFFLIILEAMSSQADIVQTMIECSAKINIPVWLSVSCVIDDKTKNVNEFVRRSIL